MRQVFCFTCEYKSSATLSSSVIIQPLILFNAIKIVLYQWPHLTVLQCLQENFVAFAELKCHFLNHIVQYKR